MCRSLQKRVVSIKFDIYVCFMPHSLLITWFVTRVTRRITHVELELLSLPEHMSSPPVLSEVRVAPYLVSV